MTNNQSDSMSSVFHALADPTRRSVIRALSGGSASVSELARPFEMALPSFVQHLKVLESSGLIRTSKVGRVRTCEMGPDALLSAEEWIADRRKRWEDRLDNLENYLRTHEPNKEGEQINGNE